MRSILELFGKSPFGPLHKHMEKVLECVREVPSLFEAVKEEDQEKVEEIQGKISHLEFEADQIKNALREHLPKSIFLPVNRQDLLEILAAQDTISDCAEDVAVLLTFRKMTLPPELDQDFSNFLGEVVQICEMARELSEGLEELRVASFAGPEADKITNMINELSLKEHETDRLQHFLVKQLFTLEGKISPVELMMWLKVLNKLGDLANYSERMANRLRLTLSR